MTPVPQPPAAAGSRSPDAADAVEDIARGFYGRLVACLASVSGDIAAAEDALSEAFVAALRTWPERGVPDRPDSWIVTAARRTLVDAARRRAVAQRSLHQLVVLLDGDRSSRTERCSAVDASGVIPDKRLELMFACTHPAIDRAMRAPLMLQAVLGVDARRIGAAFLVPPATMGQRLVRAKARSRPWGCPSRCPIPRSFPNVASVLDAVSAAYGTGWDDTGTGPDAGSGGAGPLAEAIRCAGVLTELLPGSAEAHGLLSLLVHSNARHMARRRAEGEFVPLDRQDVALWDARDIHRAERHLAYASRLNRPKPQLGPYQLQAAIQSVHNRRAVTGTTDWSAISALYDGLVSLTPTVGACVARAKAVSATGGPRAAFALLDELPPDLVQHYQPYWVVLAHCRMLIGDQVAATEAAQRAVLMTEDAPVRRHLQAQYRTTPPG